MFDVQALHYRLDDPIDINEFLEVILNIAYRYQAGSAFAIEGGWTGVESLLQAGARHFIAVFAGVRRYDVKQQSEDADVGEMGGNCCSHHARAQDRRFTNLVCHDQANLSIIVARPCPPPMQSVAIPNVLSAVCRSLMSVAMIRAPLQPSG